MAEYVADNIFDLTLTGSIIRYSTQQKGAGMSGLGKKQKAVVVREKQRKEKMQGKATELQKVEVWLTAPESPRTTVSSEENYLAEKTQLAGKMSTTGANRERTPSPLGPHQAGQAHLHSGSHSNAGCLWHQAADEKDTIARSYTTGQHLTQTEISFDMQHWPRDHKKTTCVALGHTVSQAQ
ncbi:hypothetical protein DUI87_14784 [Hirundo rustica rustica]|uniref:Uncharacterized protein n=1 Tax=Hirundo rustica rustica TaxID=333673 RepID=A0A3M0KMV2_HIRRU|nr:hypothetical protein DUI87_14784 [Hirundo rustica rustica]